MNAQPLLGPYGSGALKYAAQLIDCGANAVWFHGFNTDAFEICQKHSLAACVEFKTFRADFKKRPELIPIGIEGKSIRFGRLVQGVCLSKGQFLGEIEQDLLAGVRKFRPVGIWLDYLTYPGWFELAEPDLQQSCFCPDCIADFCRHANVDATAPAEILSRHQDRWTQYKCRRIAALGARYAEIIRSHLPGCVIGAYMCPWTPDEFDGALTRIFAQDYSMLAPSIDVFTPLIYAKKSGRSGDWGCEFLQAAPKFVPADRKVQLILDVLDFPDSLRAAASCPRPSWGVQLFGGAEVFADPQRAGIFREAVERIRQSLPPAPA
ncbi:MAG TPA: hypothetical protein VMZ31_20800 [Phycisphaerae bacterium]|nr:hypothetical protein [Phycisphaerae bacterium]